MLRLFAKESCLLEISRVYVYIEAAAGRIRGIRIVETELISVMAKLLFLPRDVCDVYCFSRNSGYSPACERNRESWAVSDKMRIETLTNYRACARVITGWPDDENTRLDFRNFRETFYASPTPVSRPAENWRLARRVTFKRYCRAASLRQRRLPSFPAEKFAKQWRRRGETSSRPVHRAHPVASGTTPGRLSICHR